MSGRLEFVVSHEAWYAKTNPGYDEGRRQIVVTNAAPEGGCHWEFVFQCDHADWYVRLFTDAFVAFHEEPELFYEIGLLDDNVDGPGVTEHAIRQLLLDHDVVDVTERIREDASLQTTGTAFEISAEQLAERVGRTLTAVEFERFQEAFPHSTVGETIEAVLDAVIDDRPET